ncbi:hypothetical protein HN51_022420, partial [Arachis hypogaea]
SHPNRSCRRRRWSSCLRRGWSRGSWVTVARRLLCFQGRSPSSCLRRGWSRGSWVTVARRLLCFQGRSPSLVHHWSSSLLRARLPSLVVFSPS